MTEREKIAARIRALLAKTVANGCTEEEALAAAQLAAKLLAQYGLTLDEVQMRETPFGRAREDYEDVFGPLLWRVADAIADLVGSRYWTSGPGSHPVQVNFFGFKHEVEISAYLLEICARAMRGQLAHLQRDLALLRPAFRNGRIRSFMDGMALRLAQRIRDLKPPIPPGTGLIVLRGQLIDQGVADAGISLAPSATRSPRDF
ncbi:MAG: DUF2786 domain-containing protein, partial [Pseudomonadota bacterium]